MKTVPVWLEAWNRRRVPDSYAATPWNRLLADDALYRRYAGEDAVEGEWDRKDTVFPHAIRGRPPAWAYYDDLRRMARIGEYVYLSDRPGGTGHGTAYERDRQVPIVFMGRGITGGTYAEPCGPEDIAPTLGKILGLDYPLQDAKRVLTEMVRQ
jgi:hypothetical protein